MSLFCDWAPTFDRDHKKEFHAYLQKKNPAYYKATNTLRLLEGDCNVAIFMTDRSAQDDADVLNNPSLSHYHG